MNESLMHNDQAELARLAEQHGRALQLHCYRMTGSLHDAEDLAQETFLRAWRSLHRFEGRASMRNWLYRIATNTCLSALATRSRRFLPESRSAPTEEFPGPEPALELPWLQPYPDRALENIADAAPGPDARYEMREAVRLAFIAALQHLPPRQRAVLLLRDVLGWSASECAQTLDTTVAAVNSALQRARATLARHNDRPLAHQPRHDATQDTLLQAYLRAWEDRDVSGFVALLTEDAVFSMPPWPQWYRGRDVIARFLTWTARPGGRGPFRLVPTAANGQPAFAFYSRSDQTAWRAHSIQLLTIENHAVCGMTSFVDASLFNAFGLGDVLTGPEQPAGK